MIVFDLLCADGHRFEGWFASAADFASQNERHLVACPTCSSVAVERIPSATRTNLGAEPPTPQPEPGQPQKTPDMEGKDPFAIAQILYSRMLDELLTKSEDVGKQFPEEARRIHYNEAPARAIRGQATQEEHDELVDEGIPVARLPLPPSGKLN
ncbi:MAG: putative cytosolic protein [Burkholderiales bacterium]|jgi:hypothetical protein|nr:putative cytosolic protein [Burkholderiales bacterium]